MPCFHPLDAWQLRSGEVVFTEDRSAVLRALKLPCGQCVGCRLERSRHWAVRIMHESAMHERSCFVTLTYDADHISDDFSLRYRDFQLFMKRLRKRCGHVRFFMCGEYGERFLRPHFHACLFGIWFDDGVRIDVGGDFPLFRSSKLDSLWTNGRSAFGSLTFDSAAYVARYCVKKVTGSDADWHYRRVDVGSGEIFYVEPEFARMSLKPGIGARWLDKFAGDCFPRDYCVINGTEAPVPRYYVDRLLPISDFETVFQFAAARRSKITREVRLDSSPNRLTVREAVVKGRLKLKSRSVE